MKIGINALYSMSGGYGGMQVYFENLTRSLLEIDSKNTYIFFCNAENYKELNFKEHNVSKVFCRASRGLSLSKTLWEQFILPLQTIAYGIDVLFSPAYIAPALISCKSVVTIHCTKYIKHPEDFDSTGLFVLKALIPISARKSDKIITVSNCTKSEVIDTYKVLPEKIAVIPYAAANHFNPSGNMAEFLHEKYGIIGKYILSVASTKPHKNVQGLIEAYIKLKEERGIEHKLVLVGDKRPLLKHNWFSRYSNWQDHILFTGIIPNNELSPLYSNADAFVFVSKYESFGIPIIEAMSCGTPVVTSTSYAMPEVAAGCALLADPDNTNDIAEKIYELLTKEDLKTKLVERGKKHADTFSWKNTAEMTLKVFEEIYNVK